MISTNIVRKEEIDDQSSSVLVPEASIHILSTQNEKEINTLGQVTPIFLLPLKVLPSSHLLLPLNVLPISHLLLSINILPISHLLLLLNIFPISHLLLPLKVLAISHLLLLLLDILLIKSAPRPTVTLPKNTNKTEKGQSPARRR